MSKEQQVVLLWGLPGSGKTTFAEKTVKENRDFRRLDVDHIMRSSCRNKGDLAMRIASDCESNLYPNHSVILDGLVTTNEAASVILSKIQTTSKDRTLRFTIVVWQPDREACLHNDQGRRLLGSGMTIENLPFEQPSSMLLAKFNIKEIAHLEVVRKPSFQVWSVENGMDDSGQLQSNSWCLGGTWGDCWGNSGHVESDPQPETFTVFDELLETACPSITFMQYKKVYAACCKIETEYDSDYYGGGRTNAHFVCDLKKLYEMLIELHLIEKEPA